MLTINDKLYKTSNIATLCNSPPLNIPLPQTKKKLPVMNMRLDECPLASTKSISAPQSANNHDWREATTFWNSSQKSERWGQNDFLPPAPSEYKVASGGEKRRRWETEHRYYPWSVHDARGTYLVCIRVPALTVVQGSVWSAASHHSNSGSANVEWISGAGRNRSTLQ